MVTLRNVPGNRLENRRPFTGLVSSNLTLSATCTIKMGPVLGSYFHCAEQGAWTNSPEFDKIVETYLRSRPRSTARPPNRSVSALVAEAGSISGALTVNKGVTSLADASPVARVPSNPTHNPQNIFDLT